MTTYCFKRKRVLRILATLLIILVTPGFAPNGDPAAAELKMPGVLKGRVIAAGDNRPLTGVTVTVAPINFNTQTDATGGFEIDNLPAGQYTVRFSYVGYRTEEIKNVTIGVKQVTDIAVTLSPVPVSLRGFTVLPGSGGSEGSSPTSHISMSREHIAETPTVGEDVYRVVTRQPGVAAQDYSARFTVRGGEHDQVLVLVDGMELSEPFHLKELQGGILSIIDEAVVGRIDLSTGGFSAEYGDRMSGVMDISLREIPVDRPQISAGLSLLTARAFSMGSSRIGNASCLFSARRGYADLISGWSEDYGEISPVYNDVLGHVSYSPSSRISLSANVLYARDHLDILREDIDTSSALYHAVYGWWTVNWMVSSRVFSRTLLSASGLDQDRNGRGYTYMPDFWHRSRCTVSDRRETLSYGLKHDLYVDISDRHNLQLGFDVRRLSTEYDYQSRVPTLVCPDGVMQIDVLRTDIEHDAEGTRLGLYITDNYRPIDGIAIRPGIRYDRATASGDDLLSPRFGFSCALNGRITVVGSWGLFYQCQSPHQLDVQDRDTLFYAAERAEHLTLGVEWNLARGMQLKVEGYSKTLTDLRPEYRNWYARYELFNEIQHDRCTFYLDRTRSRGIEISLNCNTDGKLDFWLSYSLSRVTDQMTGYTWAGVTQAHDAEIPGLYDQRHTVYTDIVYRPSPGWRINASWQYHTGWPYTDPASVGFTRYFYDYYRVDIGTLYSEKYPDYHRLDVRATRTFDTSMGRFSVFAEIVNLYNRRNVYMYTIYRTEQASADVEYGITDTYYSLRRIPSAGVTWTLDL